MNPLDPQANPSKDVPWYQASIPDGTIPPATYDLLENYGHIRRDSIDAHVTHVREKAWSIFPYPCIGQWRFLDLSISQQPAYARVLSMLKGAPSANDEDNVKPKQQRTKLLDLGCCFAQDVRKLIHDGAPADSLYGCDLKPEFLDLGYDLFADRDSCQAHFFAADVLLDHEHEEGDRSELAQLAGEMDIVYTASFLHLFSWDDQVKIATRIVGLLKPQKGSLVFGRQTGNVQGREVDSKVHRSLEQRGVWRHDGESFRRLWEVVGEATGSRWDVMVELYETGNTISHWAEAGIMMLRFEVTRIE